jgi:hypothetical protein
MRAGVRTVLDDTAVAWAQLLGAVIPWSPREVVRLVHDRAEDFELVDEQGRGVQVDVSNAHLVVEHAPLRAAAEEAALRLLGLVPVGGGRWLAPSHGLSNWRSPARASERALREGQEVTVFGLKHATMHPAQARLEREPPIAPALVADGDVPLVVFG